MGKGIDIIIRRSTLGLANMIVALGVVFAFCAVAGADAERITEVFEVHYGPVRDIEPAVRILLGPYGKMAVDESSSVIIVNDAKPNLDEIRALIAKLDTPPKNMLVDVEFIEETQFRSLGLDVRWRFSGEGWMIGSFPNAGEGLTVDARAGLSGARSVKKQFLRLLENRRGKIFVGESVPFTDYLFHYGANHGYISADTTFKDVGTSFSVTAKIVTGGQILVSLEPEVSYHDRTRSVFQVKNASLSVVVGDPGSLVIGGNETEESSFGANFLSEAGGRAEKSRFLMILTIRSEK